MISWFRVKNFVLVMAFSLIAACSNMEQGDGFALLGGGKADVLGDERVVFINYWAVWCGPCIAEMPELAEFSRAFAERAVVYAVNFDGVSEQKLQSDIDTLGVEIPAIILDPQPELGFERPQVLPTTYVFQGGELRETLVGPQTLESMETLLLKWEST